MSEKIVQLNEEVINGQITELMWGSVERMINGILEAGEKKLTKTVRYKKILDK
ncbi:hypothetical protein [Anaerotignum sp.]